MFVCSKPTGHSLAFCVTAAQALPCPDHPVPQGFPGLIMPVVPLSDVKAVLWEGVFFPSFLLPLHNMAWKSPSPSGAGGKACVHFSLLGSGCITAACCNPKNKHLSGLPDACSTLGGGPGLNPPSCAGGWGWGRGRGQGRGGGLVYPLPAPSGPRGASSSTRCPTP